jgi:hypothetical protein
MKIAALLLAAFALGYGVAVWRISRNIKKRLAALTAQLKSHSDPLAKSVAENQPKV